MSIPDEAVEAAYRAWREQANLPGTIHEYNLRAALEAAAPFIAAQALREAAHDLGWLGAQGNTVEPDTAWAGITACSDVLEGKAALIEEGRS